MSDGRRHGRRASAYRLARASARSLGLRACLVMVLACYPGTGVGAAIAPSGQGGQSGQGERSGLAEARAHYNAGRWQEAIAAADTVWRSTGAPGAAVVLARARLQQFRASGDPSELDAARTLLRDLDPATLSATERAERDVGIAMGLFFERRYGPAAELLHRLLRETAVFDAGDRDRLVRWWATALEHDAQKRPEMRAEIYDHLVDELEEEIARNPASAAAPYWLAEAVRATGALDRAWSVAVAAWVQAPADEERREALRRDLDRLVLQDIVPAMATRETGEPEEHPDTIAVMARLAAEWEAVTRSWMRE